MFILHYWTSDLGLQAQENLPVVRDYSYSAANATKEGATVVFTFMKTQGANAIQFLRTNVFV